MASRVTVRLRGTIGLDDADRLLAELTKKTELDWRQERPPDGKHLNGSVVEFLLSAAIGGMVGKGTGEAVGVTAGRVREVVSRWRDRRLDPPDIEVITHEEPAPVAEAD